MPQQEPMDPPSFEVICHKDPDGGYWIEAPGIPGLVSQGETMKELEENFQEAFEGYMLERYPAHAARLGYQPRPPLALVEETPVRLTVDEHGRLKAAA